MHTCSLCQKSLEANSLVTLICRHSICSECYRSWKKEKMNFCPKCSNSLIIKKNPKTELYYSEFYWLYKGRGDLWWCYDRYLNNEIEKMYIKYQKTKNENNNRSIKINIVVDEKNSEQSVSDIKACFKNCEDESILNEIIIGDSRYIINFSALRQINKKDKTKKREIKRVLNEHGIIKKYNITGVSGIKFL